MDVPLKTKVTRVIRRNQQHDMVDWWAEVKCGSADVPTCKMRTNIADIICGCDG